MALETTVVHSAAVTVPVAVRPARTPHDVYADSGAHMSDSILGPATVASADGVDLEMKVIQY